VLRLSQEICDQVLGDPLIRFCSILKFNYDLIKGIRFFNKPETSLTVDVFNSCEVCNNYETPCTFDTTDN